MTKPVSSQHFQKRPVETVYALQQDSYVTLNTERPLSSWNRTGYRRCKVGFTFIPSLLCLFLSVGCVVGPDFAGPSPPSLQLEYLAQHAAHSSTQIELNQWWTSFGDQTLNGLLAKAENQNLTLREAYERICEARSNFFLQGGQLRPNGDYVSGYSYNKNSPNSRPFVGQNGDPFNLINLGLNVSWEIDLFGKIARQIEAAGAELQFQDADFQSIRQTLFADIVVSYLRIRQLQSQVTLLEESLLIQQHTSQLVSERKEAGVSTELDTNQTDSFRYRSETIYASLKQQLELEFNNLSLLLGQTPDNMIREFVGVSPLPMMPAIPHVGFPAELLRRRPDIARQEAAVKAASAQIGIAEADLYPQLTLLGNVSLASKNLSGLFETGGLEFSVGPGITWNILHFGRIYDNIDIQNARLRQAIARYQQSVLSAVREVEDAMINHQGFLEQSRTVARAIEADEKAVQLSLERYRAGKANFQRVIDSQQQLLNDRQQSYQLQADAIAQLVRLFRAAGGNWTIGSGAMASPCGSGQCQPVSFEPSLIEPGMMQPGMITAMPELLGPGVSVPGISTEPGALDSGSIHTQNMDFLFGPLDSTPMPKMNPATPSTPVQPVPQIPPSAPTGEQTYLVPASSVNSVMLPASTIIQQPVLQQSAPQGHPLAAPFEVPNYAGESPFSPPGMNSVLTPAISAPPIPLMNNLLEQSSQIWE